ncbi:uncharacterized protein Hap1MRO34_024555 isoform 2-T2 [Clarias gariepinus]
MLPPWCFGTLLLSAVLGSPLRTNVTLESTSEPNSTSYPDDLENNKTARDFNQTQDMVMLLELHPHPDLPMRSPSWLPTINIVHGLDNALQQGDEKSPDTRSPYSPGKK